MTKRTKTIIMMLFAVSCLASCFLFNSLSFGQETPKPGTVIDKNNYKNYAHLFPPEFLRAFEDGFGLMKPVFIRVSESKSYPMPKSFLALSANNKGKYSLNEKGDLVGGWQRNGLPFPDLQREDKDWITKLMWNYAGHYMGDEQAITWVSLMQRKGERLRWTIAKHDWVYFTSRTVLPPKPVMNNPNNVAVAALLHVQEPEASKNTMTLSIRYMDPSKPDDTYIYLPNMRRVLRGDAGQRSVPVFGVISSLDDFNGFDGRTPEFTYKLVGEQKMLACMDNNFFASTLDIHRKKVTEMPFYTDNYSIVDAYVIDIIPKDPKYPQSKKRIWMEKESLGILYTVAWDRAGKFWKFSSDTWMPVPIPGDEPTLIMAGSYVLDIQFGMDNMVTGDFIINKKGMKWNDVNPAAMLMKGR